jgi:hypothetical protein
LMVRFLPAVLGVVVLRLYGFTLPAARHALIVAQNGSGRLGLQ